MWSFFNVDHHFVELTTIGVDVSSYLCTMVLSVYGDETMITMSLLHLNKIRSIFDFAASFDLGRNVAYD